MAYNIMVQVEYKSEKVDIPDTFLRSPPRDPVTITPVPFASSDLPEYDGCYAVTLDNVLSKQECDELIRLAESSVPREDIQTAEEKEFSPWRPAMVSIGGGLESMAKGYRDSDRIVWDQQDIADRIWARCLQAPGLREKTAVVEEEEDREWGIPNWEFRRINDRMRFLKYCEGQFFKRRYIPDSSTREGFHLLTSV